MNINSAKLFFETYIDNYYSSKENIPVTSSTNLERFIRIFSKTRQMTIGDQILWLHRVRAYLGDMSPSETKTRLSKITNLAIDSLVLQNNILKTRIKNMRSFYEGKLFKKQRILIEHAVLDSVITDPENRKGLPIEVSLSFLIRELTAFTQSKRLPEAESNQYLNPLIEALECAFFLATLQQDVRLKKRSPNYDPRHHYKTHLENHLASMEQEKTHALPYLILPLWSQEHAIAGTIFWTKTDRFTLTLVNTGDGAVFEEEEYCYDQIYRGLTKNELLKVLMTATSSVISFEALANRINHALPARLVNPEKAGAINSKTAQAAHINLKFQQSTLFCPKNLIADLNIS